MNDRRTVVATTTRTRPSRDNGVEVTHAFRVTPAGLADGLGLGSVLRLRPLRPTCSVPPRPASGAELRPIPPRYASARLVSMAPRRAKAAEADRALAKAAKVDGVLAKAAKGVIALRSLFFLAVSALL